MIEAIVCYLDPEGYAKRRYFSQMFERRYQAIMLADEYDSVINSRTGKREYGTAIIEHEKRL